MKIAFLNMYQGRVNRGVESFIDEISHELQEVHKVEIVKGNTIAQQRWPILWRFFIDPHGLSVVWFTLKNIRHILTGGYDIVIPSNGGFQSTITRILSLFCGFKVVIIGHSGIGWDDRFNLWNIPHLFIAISHKQAVWAKKVCPLIKVIYIPNGVNLSRFTDVKHINKNRVLCVGALTASKQIELTIQAIAHLPDVFLTIVGKGELKTHLHQIAEDLIPDRFKITNVSSAKMPSVYQRADVFTLVPYKTESFGIVFLEALASGLPVVTIDDSTRHDIVGDAGLFVDPTNTGDYALAIKTALAKNWGNNPRNQAKKFDWKLIAQKYEQVFLELLK